MQLCVVTLLQLAIIHPVGVVVTITFSLVGGGSTVDSAGGPPYGKDARHSGVGPGHFLLACPPPPGYHGLLAHQEEDAMANQPEVTLWSSVLMQAVVDLDNPVERGGSMEWFKALGEGVGSFRWVAFMLDMDPKRLRERIMARDKARREMARKVMRAPRRWQRRGYPPAA